MDHRLFFPATQRNQEPIGKVLKEFLPSRRKVLEIASGSGEHGVAFQKQFPEIIWQKTEPNHKYRQSIASWIKHEKLNNKMPHPIALNVNQKPWPLTTQLEQDISLIVCINMLHIAQWICTKSLIEESYKYLKKLKI